MCMWSVLSDDYYTNCAENKCHHFSGTDSFAGRLKHPPLTMSHFVYFIVFLVMGLHVSSALHLSGEYVWWENRLKKYNKWLSCIWTFYSHITTVDSFTSNCWCRKQKFLLILFSGKCCWKISANFLCPLHALSVNASQLLSWFLKFTSGSVSGMQATNYTYMYRSRHSVFIYWRCYFFLF